jgi:hypothetical protein
VKGFVAAFTNPVAPAFGTGEPQGKAKTCHALATVVSGLTGCVQFNITEFEVTALEVIAVGVLQVAGGAQVILEIHPGLFMDPSLLNLNVKQPDALVEVKGPGIAVPQKEPAKPPGTFPAPFALAICGAVIEFPSKTYNPSHVASVLNEVNVTVTTSPGVIGQMVTVESELLA